MAFSFFVREGVSLWNAPPSWSWNASFGLAVSKKGDGWLPGWSAWAIPALGRTEKASWGRSLLWVWFSLPTSSPRKSGSTLKAELGRWAYGKSSRRAWTVLRVLGLRGLRESCSSPLVTCSPCVFMAETLLNFLAPWPLFLHIPCCFLLC